MENTSPKPLARWIETAANIAIIIVAVAIVVVFAKNHFYPSQQPMDGSGIVKKVWLGKLDEQKEREVLAQSCSANS